MIRKSLLQLIFCLLIFSNLRAEIPRSAGELMLAIEKLNNTSRVLYLAAHPDDENTRLITWLANDLKAETAYLSLTRGDGGQNLIGVEKGSLIGVLRTQELIEARKLDGGKQFFTRAVDFGYSKNPEETFTKWNRNAVLSDVVWVIRKFQPDIIITRFPPTSRAGHGHHSASAILAEEAFDLAANPQAFPEQLEFVSVWQPKRLYFNASTWWFKGLDTLSQNNPDYLRVDVGTYNTFLGKWHTEIAGASRSMHKSQGFGAARFKGSTIEYLQYVKGERAKDNLLENIDYSWNRVTNGQKIGDKIIEIQSKFNPYKPEAILSDVVTLYKLLKRNESAYAQSKLTEVENIIEGILGLNLEANAENGNAPRGTDIAINLSLLNKSSMDIVLRRFSVNQQDSTIDIVFKNNQIEDLNINYFIPKNAPLSQPYWLLQNFENMYQVNDYKLLGLSESPAAVNVSFALDILGEEVIFQRPLNYKWTDRVEGEKVKPFVIQPDVFLNFGKGNYVFYNTFSKSIQITAKANKANINGFISLKAPNGWKVLPEKIEVDFKQLGQIKTFDFQISPTSKAVSGDLQLWISANNEKSSFSSILIDYPHIQKQEIFQEAIVPVTYFPLVNSVSKVGYIMGAGDEVPQNLEEVGIAVDMIDPTELPNINLKQYAAIILGVRALNVSESLAAYYELLLKYVKNGGNLIVQYNTNRGMLIEDFGPYPLQLSRDRVTVEEAEAKLLKPEHPVFNYPNKLTAKDFDNWVQERGLYFAGEWHENYIPLIAWNDPGETPKEGGLLVAYYGKGTFVYTGISFFRQLPAGVPGAYKLFVNLINYTQGQ